MSVAINSSPAGALNKQTSSWKRRASDDEDERRGDSIKKAKYSWYVTLESESPAPTDEDDESIYTVQGNETEFARDTSDTTTHTWVSSSDSEVSVHVEYELDSQSENENPFESMSSCSEPENILAVEFITVCDSEGLADDSDDSRSSIDSEIRRADFWTCVQCKNRNNNPLFRYCEKCYQIRKSHFPRSRPRRKPRTLKEQNKRISRSKFSLTSGQELSEMDSGIASSQCEQDLGRLPSRDLDKSSIINSQSSEASTVIFNSQSSEASTMILDSQSTETSTVFDSQSSENTPMFDSQSSETTPMFDSQNSETTAIPDSQNSEKATMLDSQSSQTTMIDSQSSQTTMIDSQSSQTTMLGSQSSEMSMYLTAPSRMISKESDIDEIDSGLTPPSDIDFSSPNSDDSDMGTASSKLKQTKDKTESSSNESADAASAVGACSMKLQSEIHGNAETSIPKNETEKAVTNPDNLCNICIERPKNASFVHGGSGHICCCYKCALHVWRVNGNRCPICNRKVSQILKNFFV